MRRVVLLTGLLLAAAGCAGASPAPRSAEEESATFERIEWTAASGRVSALRAGDRHGRRVVFVHGTPGDATAWQVYLQSPPPGVELIALDRPGFGASEPRGAVTSLADQAAAIEPLLVERDGSFPILVGHSLGGPIVVQAACDYPGRVGGLLVLAGNLDPDLEDLRWFNYAGRAFDWFLSREMRNANDELFPQRRELQALAPRLGLVRSPVVIVHGTEDSLVPFANAGFLERRLTGASSLRKIVLEGEDHFFIWSRPAVVWAALDELLARR